ncbi:MAG: cytochrome c family protein [Rubrimonas sp.]|uniref:c-type cytochrome n=1 Tax=Rubrimonas sp. TaxID=2036015 RepID=UPI002FDCEE2A
MNSFEMNKLFGAGVGALLMFLLMGFFAESIYEVKPPRTAGYAVDVPEPAAAVAEAEPEPEVDLPTLLAAADPAEGEKVFRQCAACHKVQDGANGVGPHLWGVIGREAQSVEGFRYSGKLAEVVDVWTFEEIDAFIANPKGYAPGTSMSYAGLKKPEDRAAVLVYLNEADGSPEPLPAAEQAPAEEAAETPAGDAAAEDAAAEETEVTEAPTDDAAEDAAAAEAQTETEEASAEAVADAPAEVAAEAPADEQTPPAEEIEVAAVEPASEEAPAEAVAEAPAEAAADASAGALMVGLDADFAALLAAADPEEGKKVFRKCQSCHRLGEGQNAVGPSLWGVIGRDVGTAAGFSYSDAMGGFGGAWTYAQLDGYLADPKSYMPGNKMSFAGLKKAEERAAVIAYLNEVDGSPEPLPAP